MAGEDAMWGVPDPRFLPDDRYAFGRRVSEDVPPHIDGCEVQMVEKDGKEIVGIVACKRGCPVLQRSLDRGRELAERLGWA